MWGGEGQRELGLNVLIAARMIKFEKKKKRHYVGLNKTKEFQYIRTKTQHTDPSSISLCSLLVH